MPLQEKLAATALAARRQRASDDKAIYDERYATRKAQATEKLRLIFESFNKAAASGLTEQQVVLSDVCTRPTGVGGTIIIDDPIIDYFHARCKEENLTVTQERSEQRNEYKCMVSWGSGGE
jgi:hypothetical protein